MYFIGSLMQKFDYKQSSGAFIHGLRYLIKTFITVNYFQYEYNLMKLKTNRDLYVLSNYILQRLNNSSDMYQMFSFISDIIFYEPTSGDVLYYKNVPTTHSNFLLKQVLDKFKTNVFITYSVTLEFGTEKIEKYKELDNANPGLGNENKSILLHPVLRIVNPFKNDVIDIYHFAEDLFANFTDKTVYLEKLMRILRPIPLSF
jgi:hypothetical protein